MRTERPAMLLALSELGFLTPRCDHHGVLSPTHAVLAYLGVTTDHETDQKRDIKQHKAPSFMLGAMSRSRLVSRRSYSAGDQLRN